MRSARSLPFPAVASRAFALIGVLAFVPPLEAQNDLQVFHGLLHGHSSFSDGSGTPAEAFAAARQAGLDFFAVTEHNHPQAGGDDGVFLTTPLYEELKRSADDHTEDGSFVAIYGQEVSSISKGNHVNVFNSSTIVDVDNGDFRDLYDRYLPEHPEVTLVQLNHPNARRDLSSSTDADERNNDYGIDDYNQSFPALLEASGRWVALIELIIGPAFGSATDKPHHDGRHEEDYLFYLNQGFRLGPSAGQDNHRRNWGTSTHARVGVWAAELTRAGILDALAARRTFASEDETIAVRLRAGDTWMGGTVALPAGTEARLELDVADADEPDAAYTASLFYDEAIAGAEARIVDVATFTGDRRHTFVHAPQFGGYYFVRLQQRSDDEAVADDIWTAPIWITELAPDHDDPGEEHNDEGDIPWQDAPDFIGREKVVTGRIVDAFNAGQALFLNFDLDFRNSLTLVVFDDDFAEFGGADELVQRVLGKDVRVEGTISRFRGRTQMILRQAEQLLAVEP